LPSAGGDDRARALGVLAQLTLEQKVHLLHGDMISGGVQRLGVPRLVCADGPMGIRLASAFPGGILPGDGEVQTDRLAKADFAPTAFSSTLGLAAAFDVNLAADYGRTIGREAKAAGIRVIFGPGVNLMRDPRCGRNFEYMGEDPLLTGAIAAAYIRGMQGEGVGACAKHFYANDAEFRRHYTTSNLDGRTAWEVHLQPFIAACRDGGVWSIMTGNNLVNGRHISENTDELKAILRDRLDWDGVILTDWRAAYGPLESIEGGTTMTTGFCRYVFGDGRLLDAVRDGSVSQVWIDERARDVLTLYARTGMLDEPADAARSFDPADHHEKARRFARDGMVLLTNAGDLLPLAPVEVRKLVVTGPAATTIEIGGGSSKVTMADSAVSPLAGLVAAFGKAEVVHEVDVDRASALAAEADAAIYFARGPSCGEGFDLESTALPGSQASEIATLAAACDRLVVVLQCGTAVDIDAWADEPAAILVAWYGGQMLGAAVADILSGAVSPSGKLPCTFGNPIDDYPCARLDLWPARLLLDEHPPKPGYSPAERRALCAYEAAYDEGVLIGYRWFQREAIPARFAFGFGLSYTTFEVADMVVEVGDDAIDVTCTVRNAGSREGAEVVQVYVQPLAGTVARPLRELKGFVKVLLAAGEAKTVSIRLPASALAYYDATSSRFKASAGSYKIQIGASCDQILLQETVTLAANRFYEV